MVQERPVRVERRLAAILAADVSGYSRLMHRDEEATHARLTALLTEIIHPAIAEHGGRTVKNTGDGLLAEFPSAVEAVRAAVQFQVQIKALTIGEVEDGHIAFRVGVNIGDVIIEPHDIFGDGVNIAARLESIAEPGGICVSSSAYDQVRGKVGVEFADLGEQNLKNIAHPVHVFALQPDVLGSLPVPPEGPAALRSTPRRHLWAGAAIALAVVGGVTAAAWWFRPSSGIPSSASNASNNAKSIATITHATSAPRFSIVVLPFANLSSDPDQEYFADGITDDLTTDLSRVSGSFVIARNTAFTFKGKPVDIKQVGRELNVRYVLEGSVRRDGDQVRVNTQLIDAETGAHIWADRFDKDRADIFKMQNEVTARIAGTLNLELIRAESQRAEREHPDNPDAVDLAMRGWAAYYRPRSRQQLAEARMLFERALRINPQSPEALHGLASTLLVAVNGRFSDAPAADLTRADEAVGRVLSNSPGNALAHDTKGWILWARKQFGQALAEFETAINFDRNLADAYAASGFTKLFVGQAEQSFAPIETAIQLSPRDPLLNVWLFYICHAHTHLGHDNEAIDWCSRSIATNPAGFVYIDLISAYGWKGQKNDARAAIAELNKQMPNYTVRKFANEDWSDNPVFLAQYQRIIEGLRKAGLPEE
ncbi:TolB amino-terminal domain-containing protein [Bradyrhizobium sp. Rc2d]|uniref:adenylate/guanylate cyclase domain-containing protein n=1 Tax=Bradyrhizobium sp. Rc2d TaxID=1855321 RepID=UPI00088B8EF8|nr:adenylate/guanylate cyclase domain-containing protein [Bradyrhizobium sp. Rc2d]SDJ53071.1 TolB amino-terminal domain-containing protein [Bradyrhizobium sp. Rc2d]